MEKNKISVNKVYANKLCKNKCKNSLYTFSFFNFSNDIKTLCTHVFFFYLFKHFKYAFIYTTKISPH